MSLSLIALCRVIVARRGLVKMYVFFMLVKQVAAWHEHVPGSAIHQ